METKTQSPSFTVSLRGYDREEVDQYIDTLAEALEQVDDSAEHNRRLQSHINRLNARIKDLEDRINSEAPRTGVVVGERIGILLRQAEDAATETLTRSEAAAAEILADADAKHEEAKGALRAALSQGEEHARRIESAARAEAAEIVAEAEARASARTRQIEQWAEQVISHTRAEEARMLREQQDLKKNAKADLEALTARQEDAARVLTELRDSLAQALGLIEMSPADEPEDEIVAEPEAAAKPAVEASSLTAVESPAGGGELAGDGARAGQEGPASHETEGDGDAAHINDAAQGSDGAQGSNDHQPGVGIGMVAPADRSGVAGPFDNEADEEVAETPTTSATDDDTPSDASDAVGTSNESPHGDEAFEAKLEAWVSGGSQDTYRYR
jgi:DivIVA domain-containing protein